MNQLLTPVTPEVLHYHPIPGPVLALWAQRLAAYDFRVALAISWYGPFDCGRDLSLLADMTDLAPDHVQRILEEGAPFLLSGCTLDVDIAGAESFASAAAWPGRQLSRPAPAEEFVPPEIFQNWIRNLPHHEFVLAAHLMGAGAMTTEEALREGQALLGLTRAEITTLLEDLNKNLIVQNGIPNWQAPVPQRALFGSRENLFERAKQELEAPFWKWFAGQWPDRDAATGVSLFHREVLGRALELACAVGDAPLRMKRSALG